MKKTFLLAVFIILILTGCVNNRANQNINITVDDNNYIFITDGDTEYYVSNIIVDDKDLHYKSLGYLSYLDNKVQYIESLNNFDGKTQQINGLNLSREKSYIGISNEVYELKKRDKDLSVALDGCDLFISIKNLNGKINLVTGTNLALNPDDINFISTEDNVMFEITNNIVDQIDVDLQIGYITYNDEQLFKLEYNTKENEIISYNKHDFSETFNENIKYLYYGYVYSTKSGAYVIEKDDKYFELEQKLGD